MTDLQITPICSYFSKMDSSVFCPDYGSSDCPFSLDSDIVACPKTKHAVGNRCVEFSLPCGEIKFEPSCFSCAHLVSTKGTRLCGFAMDNDRYKEVESTDTCENWLYDV